MVRALRLDPAKAERGHYGYNALLVGLATGAFVAPGAPLVALFALLVLAAALAVLVHAALESSLGGLLQLPALTLPFVATTWLVLLAAPRLEGVTLAAAGSDAHAQHLPAALSLYLRSLGVYRLAHVA
jgi:urea transporter